MGRRVTMHNVKLIQYAVDNGKGISIFAQAVNESLTETQILTKLQAKHPNQHVMGFVVLPELFQEEQK
jgi:hypothetical protein